MFLGSLGQQAGTPAMKRFAFPMAEEAANTAQANRSAKLTAPLEATPEQAATQNSVIRQRELNRLVSEDRPLTDPVPGTIAFVAPFLPKTEMLAPRFAQMAQNSNIGSMAMGYLREHGYLPQEQESLGVKPKAPGLPPQRIYDSRSSR